MAFWNIVRCAFDTITNFVTCYLNRCIYFLTLTTVATLLGLRPWIFPERLKKQRMRNRVCGLPCSKSALQLDTFGANNAKQITEIVPCCLGVRARVCVSTSKSAYFYLLVVR